MGFAAFNPSYGLRIEIQADQAQRQASSARNDDNIFVIIRCD
jgi:hypothetical protein